MKFSIFAATALAGAALAGFMPAATANADAVSDFYSGKTISLYVGVSPGGIYSTFAQMMSRHFGQYVPGKPNVIVKHLPGAGGVKALNDVYNVAPRDGTQLVTPNAGLAKRVALRISKVKYDPLKMAWLGGWGEAINTITLRKPAPAMTLKDAMKNEVIMGTIGKSSNTYLIPSLMNNLLGTKFKLITGYRGGSPIRLAIDKRELHGWAGQWLGWKLRKSDWIRDKQIVNLVQLASKKAPDLQDVPLLTEFARNDEERAMFKFASSGISDRALALPPGVPEARAAALSVAYQKMLGDAAFLKDAARQKYTIDPISRADVTKDIEETMGMPSAFINKMRKAMGLAGS